MRRLFAAAALLMAIAGAAPARAQDTDADAPRHYNGGLGFHNIEAPVGFRWWFAGQKVGLDAGIGFGSVPSAIDPDEKEMSWAIDVGVPFVISSWQRLHLMIRPGLLYESEEIGFDEDPGTPGVQFDTESQTTFTISGEIEAEVFLTDNFSVSASHGLAFENFDPGFGGDSSSSFGTLGRNFTDIGFHVYFFGGGH